MDPSSGNGAPRARPPRRRAALSRPYWDDPNILLLDTDPSPPPKHRKRTPADLQRETETEAMLALSLGFPIDSLLDDEVRASVLPSPHSQNDYIVVRNHILSLWRLSVRSWLSKAHVHQSVAAPYHPLVSSAYDFLLHNGFINFGVAPALRPCLPSHPPRASILVIGAGLSGLSAASQLLNFGFKILVLEARTRPGGRVYTRKDAQLVAAVELGGSVITGIHANPLGVLARQLGIPLHKIRDSCPLYRPDGAPVAKELDAKVETIFNMLLERTAELRSMMGEAAETVSLGDAIERIRALYGILGGNEEERELLNWHLANLEYANAGRLSELSLAYWDQDDPYEMGGDHCFLAGGNWRLIDAMCENIPILYGKQVESVSYGGEEEDGVEVAVTGGQVFKADMVLCTVPLGVLKKGTIRFVPELPREKLDAIGRLGFGLLNKVAMVFPYVFWGEDVDTFGYLSRERCKRGEFFLFYSYHTVSGGPVLIALVAGKAALEFEQTDPTIMLHRVLGILRGIFSQKGISVPDPIQSTCTKWGSDPFSYGSYSHIRVGSSGKDYDILAQNVMGRLFFAGEATSRQYPATMHGAFLSGLREAASILHECKGRETSGKMEIKKSSQTNSKICLEILQNMFKNPDMTFGNLEFVFNPLTLDDSKALGLMRFSFPRMEDDSTNDILRQNLMCKWFPDTQLKNLHLYSTVTREQAAELQHQSNDNEKPWHDSFKRFGLQLMGGSTLCSISSSLITSIASSRKSRRGRHSNGMLQRP